MNILKRTLFAPVISLVVGGCSSPDGPSVLLITIDTLRADRLGCYGYRAAQTPNIDRLAAEGVLFEQVGAQVPVTLPSHATILTGLTPAEHGVHDNSTFSLSDTVTTVAEVFREAGYRTGAVMGAYVLARQFGLRQGFGTYEDSFVRREGPENAAEFAERPATEVTRLGLEWLEQHGGGPFFLWLHYFDPHFPYDPPPPFADRFAENPYDGEVAYVDEQIGWILSYLDDHGLRQSTVVVLLSDHGKGLWEHGEETHAHFVYESTMRVPWIMRWSGELAAGVRMRAVVSTVDVASTLLALANPGHIPESMKGVDALRLTPGAVAADSFAIGESLLPLYNFDLSPLVSVRTTRWKCIAAPDLELYDLVADPHETVNVAESYPRVRDHLSGVAASYAGRLASHGVGWRAVSEGERRKLEALGYLGSPPSPVPGFEEWGQLGDPKANVALMQTAFRAPQLIATGRASEALPLLGEALEEAPGIPLLRQFRAWALYEEDRPDEAVEELRRGIALDSSRVAFHVLLGKAEILRGNPEAAVRALDRALQSTPFDPELWYLKGTALQALGRHRLAAQAFGAAVGLRPSLWEARLSLGWALLASGSPDSALRAVADAMTQTSRPAEVHLLVGRCHEAKGQWLKAATSYREATEEDSTLARASRQMALCYHRAGMEEEAGGALEEHLERYGEDTGILSLVAGWRLERGDTVGAVSGWERAVTLDSSNVLAWAGLVMAAAGSGDTVEAGRLASRARAACAGDSLLEALLRNVTGGSEG